MCTLCTLFFTVHIFTKPPHRMGREHPNRAILTNPSRPLPSPRSLKFAMTQTQETPEDETPVVETLSQFNLAETDDGYLLEIGGDGGSVLTLAATAEQIDAIIEALDALLSAEVDAVEDDEELS